MTNKKELNQTEHNAFVQSFQENLQDGNLEGVNSSQTSSPTDAQIGYCAKFDDGVDAVAEDKIYTVTYKASRGMLMRKFIDIYNEKKSLVNRPGSEFGAIVKALQIEHLFK